MGVNLGFRLKKVRASKYCLVSRVGLCLDLDGTSCIGFVRGKYVDPFGFRRLDALFDRGWEFHGREFRV
jgi:hypothetical protein